jgi:tetratricopeptide (TPR) repeat protein
MADKKNEGGSIKISEKINDFLQKNRKALVSFLVIIIAGIAGFVAVLSVRERLMEKDWGRVEGYISRYEEIKAGTESVYGNPDQEKLLEEILEFTGKSSGFPAARAYSIIASIHEDGKNWAEAETAWAKAAKAAAKTYFAPVSFFHAAAACEERGDLSSAVEYYKKAVEMNDIFPAAPRAQFSIGRIQESQGESAGALETYTALVERWPNDPFWGKLAQSRILVIEEQ